MASLYANFFRIFMQFVSNSLWSKCNLKQCVWPEISICGLIKQGFSTQRGLIKLLQIVMINNATWRGIPLVEYQFYWPHQKKKKISVTWHLLLNRTISELRIEEIIRLAYSCPTSDRRDLHDMITQTKKTTRTHCPTAKHKWQRKNMITTTSLTECTVLFNQ